MSGACPWKERRAQGTPGVPKPLRETIHGKRAGRLFPSLQTNASIAASTAARRKPDVSSQRLGRLAISRIGRVRICKRSWANCQFAWELGVIITKHQQNKPQPSMQLQRTLPTANSKEHLHFPPYLNMKPAASRSVDLYFLHILEKTIRFLSTFAEKPLCF